MEKMDKNQLRDFVEQLIDFYQLKNRSFCRSIKNHPNDESLENENSDDTNQTSPKEVLSERSLMAFRQEKTNNLPWEAINNIMYNYLLIDISEKNESLKLISKLASSMVKEMGDEENWFVELIEKDLTKFGTGRGNELYQKALESFDEDEADNIQKVLKEDSYYYISLLIKISMLKEPIMSSEKITVDFIEEIITTEDEEIANVDNNEFREVYEEYLQDAPEYPLDFEMYCNFIRNTYLMTKKIITHLYDKEEYHSHSTKKSKKSYAKIAQVIKDEIPKNNIFLQLDNLTFSKLRKVDKLKKDLGVDANDENFSSYLVKHILGPIEEKMQKSYDGFLNYLLKDSFIQKCKDSLSGYFLLTIEEKQLELLAMKRENFVAEVNKYPIEAYSLKNKLELFTLNSKEEQDFRNKYIKRKYGILWWDLHTTDKFNNRLLFNHVLDELDELEEEDEECRPTVKFFANA